MHSKIESLVEKLNTKFAGTRAYTFSVTYGKKYAKIVQTFHGGNSVYMFVDTSTWAVYKPASWNAPAKGIRYFITTNADLDKLISVADPYGSFLYAR